MSTPEIVSREQWQTAQAALLTKEKAAIQAKQTLAAERRAMPMVEITTPYFFQGPDGPKSLLELFGDHRQLAIYHFMFGPDWDAGCPGCSYAADNFADPAHLAARDTGFALVSRAPIEKLVAYADRMGWSLPWYSSYDTTFNQDFGVTKGDDEDHGMSFFLRDGDRIFQTYFAGPEIFGSNLTSENVMDFTPLPCNHADPSWMRRHDEYTN